MRDYSKFSAIIIGAGVSTGSAITRKFAEMGYHVCPVRRERNFSELEKLANGIKEAGYSATPFGVDARDEDAIAKLFKEVEENIAPIDVVVFNPGANVFFPIEDTTARVYKKVWEMAAFAGFLTGREAAKYMKKRGHGSIFFTGATASIRGGAGFSAFSGAKFALRSLSQSMARELGPQGIHVAHFIIDGAIDTPFIKENFPDTYALKEKDGILQPKEIAEAYWKYSCTASFSLDSRDGSKTIYGKILIGEIMSLKDKVIFVSGGSRGIGLAIAKRAAQDGAKLALAAKTADPHPKLPGTIYTAAEEIAKAGGEALPLICDIRDEDNVREVVNQTVEHFGGIDICINNASAIQLTNTMDTEMKRYDLMHQINGRGTYMVSRYCLPHLLKAENPHILNLSPPLDMSAKWFAGHTAYTMAKYNMSMCVLGMAEEFKDRGVAVNAIWPRTAIATAAVQNHLGGDEIMRLSRTPEIMADAAYEILTKDSKEFTGNFCIDDVVLHEAGVKDFSKYASVPFNELMPDFFVPDDTPLPEDVKNS